MTGNFCGKLAAMAAAVLLALTGAAAARTPLEKTLRQRDYVLPNVIDYDDFYDAAFDEGMVEIEEVLAKNKVPIRGEGDRRYLRRADLLRLCGKDCSYDKGWGIFLSQFAVQRHRR